MRLVFFMCTSAGNGAMRKNFYPESRAKAQQKIGKFHSELLIFLPAFPLWNIERFCIRFISILSHPERSRGISCLK